MALYVSLTSCRRALGDVWLCQLYAAMHFTDPWAAVYFIALNLIGTYIILNLFLAILLSNFERFEVDDDPPGGLLAFNSKVLHR